ncbi:MAG: DUF1858 domain-containing protein [Sphaerochaetaceae bacterium]|jgi:hypothetical protein|nr:DUF1858 domain-containing protein [Sphaerochaetaceae bacterium]NLO59945.1 DUF1858 domain-containing protein [Spirochaetales bacterium]MDD2405499.1 DUF1858 domain-containing protein [Sphaerochaetaceae bacterium]MDD3671638.1 DUF1858 domain-containing protein [Sphaerochaetaceae bacterium]MDD4258954.1 DUF1858 domain-containing protein [Sphaerochaetaceae bacterium]
MQQKQKPSTCYSYENDDRCATKKCIDLSKTVNQLCTADPELESILADIGFVEIVKPLMLSTVGRVMTIPKGCALRNIDLETVKRKLVEHGYTLEEEHR